MNPSKILRFSCLVFVLNACATSSPATNRFQVTPAHVKSGSKIAVSTDGTETARIAEMIHQKGGNWADVFVATTFAISVERPQSTGIGGGGFALVHVARERKTYAFDFREAAPAQLAKKYKELFGEDGKRKSELSSKNVRGSGVPGIVAGAAAIHAKWGKLSWKELVSPAAELATRGFVVDRLLAQAIQLGKEKLLSDPTLKAMYSKGENLFVEGDTLVQTELGKTLSLIASKGSKEFYKGSINKKILAYSKSAGGFYDQKDFDTYKVIERTPLSWKERQYDFVGFPFPSFGGEATQLIQSDDSLKKKLKDEELLKEWVGVLQNVFDFRAKKYEAASDKPQTTQISIIDAEGNAVSTTQTVNSTFGSGKLVPNSGIILNDEMDDFYYENAAALNHPSRTPRPLSSMAPVLVFDGEKVKLASGSQGGRRLIACLNWVMVNYLWQGKTLEEAVSSPRVHLGYPNKTLIADTTTPASWFEELKDYKVEPPPVDCRTQSVEFDKTTGIIKSVIDPRSTGRPVAF